MRHSLSSPAARMRGVSHDVRSHPATPQSLRTNRAWLPPCQPVSYSATHVHDMSETAETLHTTAAPTQPHASTCCLLATPTRPARTPLLLTIQPIGLSPLNSQLSHSRRICNQIAPLALHFQLKHHPSKSRNLRMNYQRCCLECMVKPAAAAAGARDCTPHKARHRRCVAARMRPALPKSPEAAQEF